MAIGKMPRRFWSYTAGKGDFKAEDREGTRERRLQNLKETLPGLLGFGVVLFCTAIMLLMIFAEFRGFYLDQISELIRPR